MCTGYILSLIVYKKNKIDHTTKYLIYGMIVLTLGSLIVMALDLNYTTRLWGKAFPLSCSTLFLFGLIHGYSGRQ